MNTVKVVGGGPLVGRTFYGTKVDQTDETISVTLDELIHPQEKPHQVFKFSLKSGYLITHACETDLLKLG